jgi:hypothetical protein
VGFQKVFPGPFTKKFFHQVPTADTRSEPPPQREKQVHTFPSTARATCSVVLDVTMPSSIVVVVAAVAVAVAANFRLFVLVIRFFFSQ